MRVVWTALMICLKPENQVMVTSLTETFGFGAVTLGRTSEISRGLKVLVVLRVRKEIQALGGFKAMKAPKAFKVPKVTRVILGTPVLEEKQDLEVLKAPKEKKALEVCKDLLVTKVKKDPRVNLATGVLRATRVTPVSKDLVVTLVLLVRLVRLVAVVCKVFKEKPDQEVLRVSKGHRVFRVPREKQVHVDQLVTQGRGSVHTG